jgi:hypothetical protein
MDPRDEILAAMRRALARRRELEKDYSLRRFARELRIPASTASEILTEKRQMSLTVARRIAESLAEEPRPAATPRPPERGDYTDVTMTIDPRRLAEAKRMVRAFNEQLARYLEAGDKTELYRFTTALVPVIKR